MNAAVRAAGMLSKSTRSKGSLAKLPEQCSNFRKFKASYDRLGRRLFASDAAEKETDLEKSGLKMVGALRDIQAKSGMPGDAPSALKFDYPTARDPTTEGFVFQKDEKTYAYMNKCAHLSLPLDMDDGDFFDYEGEHIICKVHGAEFLPETGLCVDGPCRGKSLVALAVEIRDNKIYVGEPIIPEGKTASQDNTKVNSASVRERRRQLMARRTQTQSTKNSSEPNEVAENSPVR